MDHIIRFISYSVKIRVERWEIKDGKVTYYANYHIEDYFGFKRWNSVVMHGTYQNGILDFRGVDSGLPHWETWLVIQKSGTDKKFHSHGPWTHSHGHTAMAHGHDSGTGIGRHQSTSASVSEISHCDF